MSQRFEDRFTELKDNDPTRLQTLTPGTKAVDSFYADEGYGRNLCFIWPDGKRVFLGYNYLVSGRFVPQDGIIVLTFTTHTLILKGINLERLFNSIFLQQAKKIMCFDVRYNVISPDAAFVVNDMQVRYVGSKGESSPDEGL